MSDEPKVDEPPPDEVPQSRRRRQKRLPPSPEQQAANREAQAQWMKEQFDKVEREYDARMAALRAQPEHPSPYCARLVKKFSGLGLSIAQLTKILCIGREALLKHYRDEIDLGKAEVTALVAGNMFRIATSDMDPNAARVGLRWLELQGGEDWKTQTKEKFDEGPALRTIDSSKLSQKQRQQLRDILTSLDVPQEALAPDDSEPQVE